MAGAHWLDGLAGRALARDPLFEQGWGDQAMLERLRSHGLELWSKPAPLEIVWSERGGERHGLFRSPLADLLPRESQNAQLRWLGPESPGPAVVLLAASGEEGYGWRTKLVGPLAGPGLRALVLENPLYGLRRPAGQRGARLRTVSDLLLMNRATIEEARALLAWLRERGYGPLGVAGFSMGGFMSALTAVHCDFDVACAALAAGRSAAPVYTTEMLSRAIPWERLGRELGGPLQAKARMANVIKVADLDRLPPPKRPDAAVVVACLRDGYVPYAEVEALHRHWAGSDLRTLPTGHAAAVLGRPAPLRQALADALACLSPA